MSKPFETVECSTHGSARAAYVCQHLTRGEELGFFWGVDPDEPNSPFPDAWCEACESMLDEQGEWTDEASDFAGVTLVCGECYVDIRARNWQQDQATYEALAEELTQELQTRQTALWNLYQIDQWERWDWFLDTRQLIFSHQGEKKVIADVAFVGSHLSSNDTWMWSWANRTFPAEVQRMLEPVREYGEQMYFMKLAAGYWHADEQDGWLMTAFVSHLLGGIGAYRTPKDDGFTYMVILNARWAQ